MRSRTVTYTAGEMGQVKVVDDFLPPPNALVDAYAERQPVTRMERSGMRECVPRIRAPDFASLHPGRDCLTEPVMFRQSANLANIVGRVSAEGA